MMVEVAGNLLVSRLDVWLKDGEGVGWNAETSMYLRNLAK
jgi:hypothetical protein